MSTYDEAILEDVDEAVGDDESYDESDDEGAEAFNPFDPLGFAALLGGRRSARVAQGRNYYNPMAPTPFVPRTEFMSAMNKVRADIGKNGAAIRVVNNRVNGLQAAGRAQGQALKKQNHINVRQSKQIAQLRTDMKKAQERALLMTLLMQPKKTQATSSAGTVNGAPIPQGSHLLYETGDSNSLLLMLLLLGGDSGSGGGGLFDNPLFLMLAFSGGGIFS